MPALCLRLVWGLQLCLDAAGARAGEGAGEAAERPRKRFLSLLSPPSRSMLDCASKMDRPGLGALHVPDQCSECVHPPYGG